MSRQAVTLFRLAYATHVYHTALGKDDPYDHFSQRFPIVDLSRRDHCLAVLTWLRKWQCRQFDNAHTDVAVDNMQAWYADMSSLLPNPATEIVDLTDVQIGAVGDCFDVLKTKRAGKRDGSWITVGPTGAAKILFCLRPRSLCASDKSIWQALLPRYERGSYSALIRCVKRDIDVVRTQCQQLEMGIEVLPVKLGKAGATLVKLMDEFYWVTCTRHCPFPDSDQLSLWQSWLQRSVATTSVHVESLSLGDADILR